MATHSLTPDPGDPHEPDDTCSQARLIPTDGTTQDHTFHQLADQDWIVFEAVSSTTYLIVGQVPAGSPADLLLELYDRCEGMPLISQDYTFTPDVRMQFQASVAGRFYLRLADHTPSVYGSHVAYNLSVRVLSDTPAPGALVLVAGRYELYDPLQENVHHVTSAVYNLFQAHGYGDDRIFYLATDLTLPGVDALPTQANLQAAITTWALDKVGPGRPFTLYLVGAGSYDLLYLDRPGGEAVTPGQLDAWLAALEAGRPGVEVNVIVEACRSGSFIDLPQTVSEPGRVVISSTGAWNPAWATAEGALFSGYFIAALDQDESLYASFLRACEATRIAHPDQTPWLDDNGNGLPNEPEDGQEAQRRCFAYPVLCHHWPPYIWQVLGPDAVAQGRGVIRANVLDDEAVHRVWAEIYPSSYRPPQPEAGCATVPPTGMPTVVLQDQGNDWYAATYTGFDEAGLYRIVVYAEDNDRLEARPVAVEVRTGWQMFLPMLIRDQ
jgi:hypothetical protein